MARLTSKQRNSLPDSDFAGPNRSYPMEDANHAKAALSMASRFASPSVQSAIKAKAKKKFGMGGNNSKNPYGRP